MINQLNLAPNTVAFYEFEKNGLDRSVSRYNLAQVGTVPYSSSSGNYNSQFAAGPFTDADYFTVPTALKDRLVAARMYSIQTYIYLPGVPRNYANIYCSFNATFGLGPTADKVRWFTSASDLIGNKALSPNRLYHIAWVWDGTNKKIYVDGVLDVSSATSAVLPNEAQFLGRYASANFSFNGQLDQFRISVYTNSGQIPTRFPTNY